MIVVGVPLLAGYGLVVVSFLYAIIFSGSWAFFYWIGSALLIVLASVKLFAASALDEEKQLIASAMLWELFGGAAGYAWMALAVASLITFAQALFFAGSWWRFFVCLIASAVCKYLVRSAITWREATAFKLERVRSGMSKAYAQQAWIAEAQRRLRSRT
jgi:hypothetical protein